MAQIQVLTKIFLELDFATVCKNDTRIPFLYPVLR